MHTEVMHYNFISLSERSWFEMTCKASLKNFNLFKVKLQKLLNKFIPLA